jgi:hypothetical protein
LGFLAAAVERPGYFSDPFFFFRTVRKNQFYGAAGSGRVTLVFRALFLTSGKKGNGTGGGNQSKAPRANLSRRRFVPGAPPPYELENRTSLLEPVLPFYLVDRAAKRFHLQL